MTAAFHQFSLREVAALTGLTARAIRFYDEHKLVHPRRNEQNRRAFDWACVERLRLIAQLRSAGLSIVDIRCVLCIHDLDPSGATAANAALQALDARAQALQEQLSHVRRAADEVVRRLVPQARWAAE